MKNQELASIFSAMAAYLEMDEIPFKPQAYEKAALTLENLPVDVEEIYKREGEKGLQKIPGIGKRIANKIVEYLHTGKIKEYEKMRKKVPVKINELMKVEGLGPKMIKELYQHLKITNLEQLEKAAQEGKIRNLPRFGLKTEQNILQGIQFVKRSRGRFLLSEALPLAEEIIASLKKLPQIDKIVIAGSLRRRKETIGDIDLLATIKPDYPQGAKKVMDTFVNLPGIIKVWDYGLTKSSVRFKKKIDVDLRVVKEDEFGSALQYFTGSKEHNIATRKIAISKGLKLNEYGVFRKIRGKWKKIAGATEEEVYQAIGLPYIEPELRTNRGEIEVALQGKLPRIIKYNEIRGDLHNHSSWDGGKNSIREMAEAARLMGYEYIGITDHTKFLRIEHGLDEKQLLDQHKEIEKLNAEFKKQKINFRILHGCEANILNDGSLDIEDKVLAQLDYVIAGVHSSFKMKKEEMTQRIIRAIKNPYVKIISHPTGRLINRRDAYPLDIDKILNAALETNTALEINACPERLDLNDINIRKAVEKGVKLAIDTDSHEKTHLQYIHYGIAQARRGWATPKDIINSWPLPKLLRFFQKK